MYFTIIENICEIDPVQIVDQYNAAVPTTSNGNHSSENL